MNLRLPSEHQRLFVLIGVGVIALLALLLVTRVTGGESDGSGDAAAVMQKGLTTEPRSAVFDLRFTGGFRASNGEGQDLSFTATGPATDGDPGKGDLKVTDATEGKRVSYRLISTGDAGFVGYEGRFYRMTAAQFQRVFAEDAEDESFFDSLGFDLERWMTAPALSGTAEVDGVPADRVTSTIDMDAFLTDLDLIGPNASGNGDAVFRGAAKDGQAELLIGQSDGILRKMTVNARVSARNQNAAVNMVLNFDIALRAVNKPVEVDAPQNPLPPSRIRSDIPRSVFSDETADELFGPRPGKRGQAERKEREAKRSREAYVNCVQQATDTAALEKCQALVP